MRRLCKNYIYIYNDSLTKNFEIPGLFLYIFLSTYSTLLEVDGIFLRYTGIPG